MKRILLYIVIAFALFSVVGITVHADDNDNTPMLNVIGQNTGATCTDVLNAGDKGDNAVELMREVLGYVRIIAPVLLIVLTAADFGSAVLQQDNDALKKASTKVSKRAIMTIAVFLVPTLIRAILGLPGVRDALSTVPDDPLCGAEK